MATRNTQGSASALPTTRRAMLAGLATAPAFVGIFAAGKARASRAELYDPAFASKLAAYRQCKAKEETFDRAHLAPAHEAWATAKAKWEKACEAIPHVTTANSYENVMHEVHRMDTANPMSVVYARAMLRDKPGYQHDDCLRTCQELIDAVERRDAEKDRLRLTHKVDDLEAAHDRVEAISERFGERSWTALWEVLEHPAATLATLVAKLDLIEETQTESASDEIAADIRRLAKREG